MKMVEKKPEADLLREADPEHQDEHRQEDRFRNAEGEEQQWLCHVGEIAVLRDQEADQRADGDGERERGHHLAGRDREIVAHAGPLQQLAERGQRVATRRAAGAD